ncbi:hypothetical protein [Desulfovulcanus sp.]
MAITYNKNTACLNGNCTVDEAEEFAEWFKKTKNPVLDLSQMEHIHTAVLQCILYFKPEITRYPEDRLWQEILC